MPNGDPCPIAKQRAEEFNNPIIVGSSKIDQNAISTISGVMGNAIGSEFNVEIICPNNLEIIALKKSEWTPSNSLILRVHEICGINSESVCISLPDVIIQRIEQIQEVDLIDALFQAHLIGNPILKN